MAGVLVEGFIWTASPPSGTVAPVTAPTATSAVLIDERDAGLESCLESGVGLFEELVRRANAGEAIGISYVGFVERVHGVAFPRLRGRQWSQSDVRDALQLADQVTEVAGRRSVRRGDVVIEAGMDTFIWPKKPPHARSPSAWRGSLPYSREDWLAVFPDGTRRLVDSGPR